MTRVSIVEYGVGNIGSVVNACRRVGVEPAISRDGAELASQRPTHILMPGVGAIGTALANLRARGYEDELARLVFDGNVPLLGICVGMQMLAEACEEFGQHRGLGWIPGRVRRLAPVGSGLRLPHVGWNTVAAVGDDPLMRRVDSQHFYFVHSFAMDCPEAFVAGRTDYDGMFVCAVRRGNIHGVQFHPEKSSTAGADLLRTFLGEGQPC